VASHGELGGAAGPAGRSRTAGPGRGSRPGGSDSPPAHDAPRFSHRADSAAHCRKVDVLRARCLRPEPGKAGATHPRDRGRAPGPARSGMSSPIPWATCCKSRPPCPAAPHDLAQPAPTATVVSANAEVCPSSLTADTRRRLLGDHTHQTPSAPGPHRDPANDQPGPVGGASTRRTKRRATKMPAHRPQSPLQPPQPSPWRGNAQGPYELVRECVGDARS
jgi:hypothetical protein